MTTRNENHTDKGRFKKGNKAAARKKKASTQSLVNYLIDNTADGQELIDGLLAITRSRKASNKDKLAAHKLLMERGWGKTTQPIDANVQGDITFRWEGEDDSTDNDPVQTTPVSGGDTQEPKKV